jgi:hypothetical protein
MTAVRASLSALGEAAVLYAGAGWRVHPVRGKVPVLAGWPERATCDVDVVAGWWREHPRANVGVATGRGLLVLDVDMHGDDDGGFATLAALAARGLHLPVGPIAETASGGAHHWLRVNGEIRTGVRFLPGLDLRGDGGQVVVPPSVTDVGTYRWVTDPPQDLASLPAAPGWLLRGLAPPPAPARPSFPSREGWGQGRAADRWLPEVARAAQGTRNDLLFRAASAVAGEAVRRRTDPRGELDALRVAARGAGLGEVEIDRTIKSACHVAGLA